MNHTARSDQWNEPIDPKLAQFFNHPIRALPFGNGRCDYNPRTGLLRANLLDIQDHSTRIARENHRIPHISRIIKRLDRIPLFQP